MAKKLRLVKIKKNGEVEIFAPADKGVASKVVHVPVANGDRLCLESTEGEVVENVKVTHDGKDLTITAANGSTQQFVLDGYYDAGVTDVEFVGVNGKPLFTSADAHAMHALLPGQSASYSAFHSAGAGGDTGPFGWPKFAMPLAIAGGLGAAALAFGGGGGGGGSSGGAAPAPAKTTIQGSFAAGPAVAGNNMQVTAYNTAGDRIGTGTIGPDGKFNLDLGGYTGLVIIRVDGKGGAADYHDEASGLPTDLTADFLAVINVGSGVNNLSINPLSAIAAKMMGLDVVNGQLDVTKFNAAKFDASKVAAKNAEVAKAFGLDGDVTKLDVTTAVDKDGKPQEPNAAGAVLAALSGMDAKNGGMQATIDLLVKTVGGPLDKTGLIEALMLGAAAADTKLHPKGGDKEVDVVNLVSNALNAVNSSAGYKMNAIAGDDTINGEDKPFKAGDTFTFKVPSGKLAASLEFWLPGANAKGAGTITINPSTNTATYTLTATEADALNALGDGVKSFQVKAAGSNATSPALTERHVYIDKVDDKPSAVTFVNTVYALEEGTLTAGKKVADIVVADADGYKGGAPTVSETTNFEVKVVNGKFELWLKNGVVLDVESGTRALTTKVTADGVESAEFKVNVIDVNEAPVTDGKIPAQNAVNNKAFSLDVSKFFKDVDAGEKLTYKVTAGTLPAGITLNASSGMLSGTANTDKPTSSTVTITVTDRGNLSVSQTFEFGVVLAPVVQSFKVSDSTGNNDKGKSGEEVSFVVTFSEAITSTGTITAVFTINGTDVTVTASAVTGAKSVTFTGPIPTTSDGSAISLKSLKSEAGKAITGDVTKQPFSEPIAGAIKFADYTVDNTKPSITATYQVDENTSSDATLKTITLAANETVTWSGLTGADAALFKLDGGKLTFVSVTDFESKDTYNVTVTGTDGAGNATTQALVIKVKDVNDAPVTVDTIPAQTAINAKAFSLDVSKFFKDVDAGEKLTYTITAGTLPAGITLNSDTGVLSGTANADKSASSVTITAKDKSGLSVSQTFEFGVISAPVVQSFKVTDSTGDSDKGKSGDEASFVVTFSEAITSTGTITAVFTVNGADVTVTATAVTGSKSVTFTGPIPTTSDGSAISLKSLKSEAGKAITGDVSKQPFAEPVAGAIKSADYTVDNTKPSITISYKVDENTSSDTALKTITLAANETVTWSGLTGADAALFKLDGGKLTFISVTDFESKDTYNVSVTGTDGAGNATTQELEINVSDVNDAPVTVGTVNAQHAVSGKNFSLDTSTFFKDVDADSNGQLTYTLSGAPSGLVIDAKTGVISGTHTGAQAAKDVTVTVTDGGGLTVKQTFSMDVLVAPTISSKLDSVKNFDVRSDLVLTASENVTAVAGKFIRIVNDGGPGYEGENTVHTFVIDVSDETQVTIKGNKITINPKFDLDLANNYHIEIDDGAFKGKDSGLDTVGINDNTTIDFSTVNPYIAQSIDTEAKAKETLDNAAASQKMAAGVDEMVASGAWVSVAGMGDPYNTNSPVGTLDLLNGGYVLLLGKDTTEKPVDLKDSFPGVVVNKPLWLNVHNFGKDDSFYIDDQFNNPDATNDLKADRGAIQFGPKKPNTTSILIPAEKQVPEKPTEENSARLEIKLAPEVINAPENKDHSTTFAKLDQLESWTQNNWAVIVG